MLDSYNKGFMTKCAEYNIPFDTAFEMLKYAQARNEDMEKQAWSYGSSALAGGSLAGLAGAPVLPMAAAPAAAPAAGTATARPARPTLQGNV